jgi:cytochrome d ubiquinol oxidase subunit I
VDLLWAAAATPADLVSARTQMAFSLGWHIIIACFGVGFPGIVLYAHWRGLRKDDADFRALAHQWAKAMGVLFAAGAVSGTILSFEMGMLWPGLMSQFGEVFGYPFTLEGFSFFIEAIFVGIYLYGWDRLPPRIHLLTGVPIVIAGLFGAFFVISANAWMNSPRGFELVDGKVVNPDPIAGMLNPATAPETVHMLLAAYMVAGFSTASVYAVGMLRGRRDRYHRLGLLLPLTVAAIVAPIQIGVGDWAAHSVGQRQPVKLAAMEGLYETQSGVPLSIGGIYKDDELRYAVEIPNALSLILHFDPNAEVTGLDSVPPEDRPPVNVVHLAFNTMVAIGFALLGLSLWLAWSWWRRRDHPQTRWFLYAVALSGVAAIIAMETGWITTEVGRQPWIVYNVLRTEDAVNPAPGLRYGLYAVLVVYTFLTVASVYVLRRLAGHRERAVAPQEPEPESALA